MTTKFLLSAFFSVGAMAASSTSRADTVRAGGAQLTLPDEGWTMKTENGHILLAATGGGAIIEVYNFSKVPADDEAGLRKLVDDRPETDQVVIANHASHQQNGLKGIKFRGTASIRSNTVDFASVALALRSRAVIAIAFTRGRGRADEVAKILASIQQAPEGQP